MTTTGTKNLAIAAALLALYGAAPAASAAGFSCSGEAMMRHSTLSGQYHGSGYLDGGNGITIVFVSDSWAANDFELRMTA
ncbi:MAG: hypothetical protein Q7T90_02535 [Thiobacillus sp.]|nr:hypothetical protein [Thiobacillus sp.]